MPRIACKVCRRAGESLCGREKCAYKKRPFAPGILDSQRKHKSNQSEYGSQLNEKRKVRESYGLREKQFSAYVEKAMSTKGGNTTELIYQSLELRLDNVVFRAGFANTRALSRQLVSHGHIIVNGRKVTIPSFSLKVGDILAVREGSKKSNYFIKLLEKFETAPISWLTFNSKDTSFTVKALPKEIEKNFNFQAIVEFYSR
jgi:small subunit ribosomal protein S4